MQYSKGIDKDSLRIHNFSMGLTLTISSDNKQNLCDDIQVRQMHEGIITVC